MIVYRWVTHDLPDFLSRLKDTMSQARVLDDRYADRLRKTVNFRSRFSFPAQRGNEGL